MAITVLILGALSAAYGVVAYLNAPTIVEQSVCVHFFVAAAVLLGCGAVADAIGRRKG